MIFPQLRKDRNIIDSLLDFIKGIKNRAAIKFSGSQKAMLDEAERTLVNLMRSEGKSSDSEVRYSYIGKNKDGYNKYKSDFSEDVTNSEKIKVLLDVLKETADRPLVFRINGKKINAYFDNVGAQKTVYGTQKGERLESRDDYNTKIDLANDIRTIIQQSKLVGEADEDSTVRLTKAKNKAHTGVLKWYIFSNNIEYNGERYNVVTDVRQKADGYYGYSVKFFSKKERNFQPGIRTKSSTDKALKVSLNDNISQATQNGNGKKAKIRQETIMENSV